MSSAPQMQAQAVKAEASLPKRAPAHPAIQPEHPVLHLQQAMGNQAMMRMLRPQAGTGPAISEHGVFPGSSAPLPAPAILQRKLTINEPGDSYEHEADRVSEHVMRMPAPGAGGTTAVSGSVPGVQLKAATPASTGTAEAPQIVHDVLRSPGQPLDKSTRAFMEPRFGHDFSGVRVHADAKAAESAKAVQAKAYTVGKDVVFGAGEYAPGSHAGQKLLGHELTHVVQQGDASTNGSNVPRLYRQPKSSFLTLPFEVRFYTAWGQARDAARQKIYKADKDYGDSSISRFMIPVEEAVPPAEDVWKHGLASGFFMPEEKKRVDEWSEEIATQTFDKRYKAAKYGASHGQLYDSDKRWDDDEEIWSRGWAYGLFLPSEKATVLRISPAGIGMAAILTHRIKFVDPKSPEAARLIDDIHDFTTNPAVVLLGPEVEKLLGPFGYKYYDSVHQASVADEINKAYQRGLPPNQIRYAANTSTQERWDECLGRRGFDKNNLEVARFDPECFQSESEFNREWLRRREEYLQRLHACGRSGPKDYECRDRVAAEYFPLHWAEYDARITQAHIDWEIYQGVVEGGPVSQGAFHLMYDVFGWSTERSAAMAGAVNTVGGLIGMRAMHEASIRSVPSNAPQPRTPISEMVEKPELMPAPDHPTAPAVVQVTAPVATPAVTPQAPADVAIEVETPSGPMRRPPGKGPRGTYSKTTETGKQHDVSTPVVEVLPRSTVPMKDFEPAPQGHYIVRKPPSAETQRQILARAGRTTDGRLRDANTGRALNEGEAVWGHNPYYQFNEMRDMAEQLGWTQEQFDEYFEDPEKWQVEYGPSNSSRVFDRIPRQRPVH